MDCLVQWSSYLVETGAAFAAPVVRHRSVHFYFDLLWPRRFAFGNLNLQHAVAVAGSGKHFGAQMRDANLEVSLHRGSMPQATSISLAELLLGRITSPTRAARRAEMQVRLQDVLNTMDPIDREVLTLRHFEELSNGETAQVLGLTKSAASNRYMRALLRLKETLSGMPGFLDP